ncbi:hypothetical protein SprV_0401393600 [Sparganum proliferum]
MTDRCPSTEDTLDELKEIDELSLCCLCGQTFSDPESLHEHFTISHEEKSISHGVPSRLPSPRSAHSPPRPRASPPPPPPPQPPQPPPPLPPEQRVQSAPATPTARPTLLVSPPNSTENGKQGLSPSRNAPLMRSRGSFQATDLL